MKRGYCISFNLCLHVSHVLYDSVCVRSRPKQKKYSVLIKRVYDFMKRFAIELFINEFQDILTCIVPCSDLVIFFLRFMAFRLLLKTWLKMWETVLHSPALKIFDLLIVFNSVLLVLLFPATILLLFSYSACSLSIVIQ